MFLLHTYLRKMDDCIVHDSARPFMVAGMAMRLDRIRHCCALYCNQCTSRSNIPRHFPGGRSHLFRDLGQPLVRLQQRGDGMVGHIEAFMIGD